MHFGSLAGHFGAYWGHLDALWGHLGVTVEHFGGTWGSPGDTFGSLWSVWESLWTTFGSLWCYFWMYEGCFGATFSYFQNMLIFPMNFNDFTYLLAHLDTTRGAFWGDFGALWRYFGDILG